MAVVSMKQLLEAGTHFGHKTSVWNPKMKPYIYNARNGIHIVDLDITVELIEKAYSFVVEEAKQGKTLLFVGTKKQAQDAIKEEAERCGMYFINERWLGGTLTNFATIRSRIDRLNTLSNMKDSGELANRPKKEAALLEAEREKLEKNLGGIRYMHNKPGVLFVVDVDKEKIAIKEAKKLGIKVVALVDTKCDPSDIDYVIPGNDDAIRSIKLIASIISNAVIEAREGISFSVEEDDDKEVEASTMEEAETVVAENTDKSEE